MTLILLHGALGAAAQLEPLAARLPGVADARCMELPGHGNTEIGQHVFSIPGFAEHILSRLDEEGIAQADVFGYSMGGYVGLTLAMTHPSRVRRVMTLGTKFEWIPEVATREASRLDPATIRAKVPRFAAQLETRHAGAGGWQRVLSSTAALLLGLGVSPILGATELGAIAQPACIAVGDRDATVSVEESSRACRLLPAGSLAVLPATPHPLEQVDFEALASIVERFLQQRLA